MRTEEFLNASVFRYTGGKEIKGKKFAIELELEGRNVGLGDVATKGWNRKMEPSLRGDSIEYTSSGPKERLELKKNVLDLFRKFKENGVRLNESIRTSTHVHLNFSDKPLKQVVNFFSLFTLLEEVLQYYSGEDRKGNLFCMSSRDAEGIVGILADAVAKGDLFRFAGDRYKYAACNLCTLYKFGTVEIRTMRGASSAEQVNKWVDILNDMYEFSLRMDSPADLVRDLSFLGAEALMKKIFSPENFTELMKGFPVIATLHYSLVEGARLIQVFAYEFDDAFKAKVPVQKKQKAHAGRLKVKYNERMYAIYKPDGNLWNCSPIRRHGRLPEFWEDGDKVSDDHRIQWSEERGRFIVKYPGGVVVECRWAWHHALGNEGAPEQGVRRQMPRRLDDEDEPEEDQEDFEIEEDYDDEGEDF